MEGAPVLAAAAELLDTLFLTTVACVLFTICGAECEIPQCALAVVCRGGWIECTESGIACVQTVCVCLHGGLQ